MAQPSPADEHPLDDQLLIAVIDRIVPPDEFAGASQAGVHHFVRRIFATDLAPRAAMFFSFLGQLDTHAIERFQRRFAELDERQQDDLLKQAEAGTIVSAGWFGQLVDLVMEGYYADPSNGGNTDQASWKMLGYSRKIPEGL